MKIHNCLLLISTILLTSCAQINYYNQAVIGQLTITQRAQKITDLLTTLPISAPLKPKLLEISKIRTFASQQLQLPDNTSYTYYADLQKPFVVWNVFAAPPFSLYPKSWCFPLIGCVSYRGYFHPDQAKILAKQLQKQGYDVETRGVVAYSTLGWFTDPILNTFVNWSLTDIAGLIFHELAHQQLYIPNNTPFNEGFATFTEREGVQQWLLHRYGPHSTELKTYQQAQQRQHDFVQLLLKTRDQLAHLYQHRDWPFAKLYNHKHLIYKQLEEEYAHLKQKTWQGYSGYDAWFDTPMNNAKLLLVVTYEDHVEQFRELFNQQGENFGKFYAAAREWGNCQIHPKNTCLQPKLRTKFAQQAIEEKIEEVNR